MINEQMYQWGSAPSAIRSLFAYGQARKAEIGEDKVFDFSIGNPSVPAPAVVADALREYASLEPSQAHAYSQSSGHEYCKQAIVDNLNERFGTTYGPENLYLTCGAAASLSCCFSAITLGPDTEIIVIAPYFPEYRTFIENAGAKVVEVPARADNFQIDLEALAAAINENTQGVVINSPNNPVGTVYTRQTLDDMTDLLRAKQDEFGHEIYLISDEPYRELVYDGVEVPWVPALYDNTLVCYSWSKSLSLPGNRIGYVLVPDTADDWKKVWCAISGAGRGLGYVCAPVAFQYVISKAVNEPADVEAYAINRKILTEGLAKLGYEFIAPDGAFYLWIKALEPDAQAFSDRAKEFEILLVPSDSFGVSGWVRAGYCISRKTIEDSLPAFAALKKSYEQA
jgi:aspartate aminotransferase